MNYTVSETIKSRLDGLVNDGRVNQCPPTSPIILRTP